MKLTDLATSVAILLKYADNLGNEVVPKSFPFSGAPDHSHHTYFAVELRDYIDHPVSDEDAVVLKAIGWHVEQDGLYWVFDRPQVMERITRNRRLTPEEVAKYNKIREQVAEELPDLIARHNERMKTKEILNRILLGMDPYLSCGVPTPYWELALELTKESYGEAGVALLESAHKTYDNSVQANDEIILHSLQLWEDGGNTEVLPKDIVERLGKLPLLPS